jgi:hypothetical protein
LAAFLRDAVVTGYQGEAEEFDKKACRDEGEALGEAGEQDQRGKDDEAAGKHEDAADEVQCFSLIQKLPAHADGRFISLVDLKVNHKE